MHSAVDKGHLVSRAPCRRHQVKTDELSAPEDEKLHAGSMPHRIERANTR
jgi:hypothetical protein